MAEKAIRRESGTEAGTESAGVHRHRVPLGLILLAQGWITPSQLHHALALQLRAGAGRIGQWLVQECGLDQERVTRGLAMQWRCPVLSTEEFNPQSMALTVPRVLVERVGMVPLRIAGRRVLYLGFEDCPDAAAAFAMKRMSGMRVESGLIESRQWREARHRLRECEFVEATYEQVADVGSLPKKLASALDTMQPRAARMVRVHQFYWMRMWLETGAMSSREGGVPATNEDVVDRVYVIGQEQ